MFSDQSQVLPEGPTAGGDVKRGLEQRFHREVVVDRFLLSVPRVLICGWGCSCAWAEKVMWPRPAHPWEQKENQTRAQSAACPRLFLYLRGLHLWKQSGRDSPPTAAIMPSNMENHTSLYIQQETVANNSRNQITGAEDIALELSRRVFPRSRAHVHRVPAVFLGSATMEIQGKPWGKAA